MRLRAGSGSFGLACLLLIGSAFVATRAEEPAPPAAKPQFKVVVKSGTTVPKQPRPIEPTSFAVEIGAVPQDTKVPITLEIHNTSDKPIKIVGGNSGCWRQGCIGVVGKYPCLIPPGEVGKIEIVYSASRSSVVETTERFDLDANFYVGATTTFAVPFRISGKVLPKSPVSTAKLP